MKVETLLQNTNRRNEVRIEVPDLEVAIRREGMFPKSSLMQCKIVDINRNGMGVLSETSFLKVRQKLVALLTYQGYSYCIQGIVVYRNSDKGMTYYGLMFVHIPYQFDQLIEKWIALPLAAAGQNQDKTQSSQAQILTDTRNDGVEIVPGTQRRIDTRFVVKDLTLQARKYSRLLFSKYLPCKLVNISKGGVSFISNEFKHELMDKVETVIFHKGQCIRQLGYITYLFPSEHGNHYGVEYTEVSTGLVELIASFGQSEMVTEEQP